MQFKDVVGQDEIKALLCREVKEQRVPHALLFGGPAGCGKLAMAVAFANYLFCRQHTEEDSCGECPTCRQISHFAYPDLHFSFPVIKKGSETTCEDYLGDWNGLVKSTLYFDLDDWLEIMGADNKKAIILEKESDRIIDELSVSSYSGGYKIMIIWLPERMNREAANNMLKTFEEPTPDTVFILVSNNPEQLLPTILSRTQLIPFRPLSIEVITRALVERNGLEKNAATQIARIAGGSYLKALQLISVNNDADDYYDEFVSLMRLSYERNLVKLKDWSEAVAAWGRGKQKAFLGYCQNMLRENFMYNFQHAELNFMSDKETNFAVKFARFINERNVRGFVGEFSRTQRDIEQNVNSRSVLFYLALRCVILIRK